MSVGPWSLCKQVEKQVLVEQQFPSSSRGPALLYLRTRLLLNRVERSDIIKNALLHVRRRQRRPHTGSQERNNTKVRTHIVPLSKATRRRRRPSRSNNTTPKFSLSLSPRQLYFDVCCCCCSCCCALTE